MTPIVITATALFAVIAMGMPSLKTRSWEAPDANIQLYGVGYQGDGSYLAAFDSNGVATVEFTPFNETVLVNRRVTNAALTDLSSRALGDITCSGRAGYIPDIDAANVQAAKNAEAHGYYNAKAWGWVSFPYSRWISIANKPY